MSVKEESDGIYFVPAMSDDGELFFAMKYESMKDKGIISSLEQFLSEI